MFTSVQLVGLAGVHAERLQQFLTAQAQMGIREQVQFNSFLLGYIATAVPEKTWLDGLSASIADVKHVFPRSDFTRSARSIEELRRELRNREVPSGQRPTTADPVRS